MFLTYKHKSLQIQLSTGFLLFKNFLRHLYDSVFLLLSFKNLSFINGYLPYLLQNHQVIPVPSLGFSGRNITHKFHCPCLSGSKSLDGADHICHSSCLAWKLGLITLRIVVCTVQSANLASQNEELKGIISVRRHRSPIHCLLFLLAYNTLCMKSNWPFNLSARN